MTIREYVEITADTTFKIREPLKSILTSDLINNSDIARELAHMGIPLSSLVPVSTRGLVRLAGTYPNIREKLEDADDLFKERVTIHEKKYLEHELYTELLWKYKWPEEVLRYLAQGVPYEFLKDNSDMPDMRGYLNECAKYGLPVDSGRHYDVISFIEVTTYPGEKYWKLMFELIRRGSNVIGHHLLPGTCQGLYHAYLHDIYGVGDTKYPEELRVIHEALWYRGVETNIKFGTLTTSELKHVVSVIATEPNIEAYISMAADEIHEIIKELPEREIPKELVGNYLF